MAEEIIEQNAKITFEIPAYKDKETGESFKRIVEVPTKKAYAIYKRTIQKFEKTE
jgi:hypothetical protein